MIIKLVRFDFKDDIAFDAIAMQVGGMMDMTAKRVFEVHLNVNSDGSVIFSGTSPSISDGKITEPENTDVHTRTADSERVEAQGGSAGESAQE